MAHTTVNRRSIFFSLVVTLAAVGLTSLLSASLNVVEDQLTVLRYAVRGTTVPDTNIVIVYIDDETIRSTEWPIPRNYYALLINTLTDLQVRAIGVEMVLETSRLEYPEYDELLGKVIASSGKVVLTSYFDSLTTNPRARRLSADTGKPQFSYPAVAQPATTGFGLHSPMPQIGRGAAGVGHVNLVRDVDIPVFVGYGDGVVPCFGAELARIAIGAERGSVFSDGESVAMRQRSTSISFGTHQSGFVALNFPGPLRTFAVYPMLEVLKSYDALKQGGAGRIPVLSFRGKIVLVGVVAEGISQSYRTSVDPRYPSIGLHATFLDNALQSRFLHRVSLPWTLILAALFGCGVMLTVIHARSPRLVVSLIGWLVLTLLSLILFAAAGIIFPVVPFLFVGAIATIGGFLYRHRWMQEQFRVVSQEKEAVLKHLRDREARLAVLEQELLDIPRSGPVSRTHELLEEIQKYKAEIRSLSSQADDMEEYPLRQETPVAAEFEGIVYSKSGRMKGPVEFVTKIAGSDAPVLILGESGTGKELIARAIHAKSTRAQGPFVAVNCGALSEGLLESELFGHDKGAFTGAVKDRMGRFELADGGTIFLDEIGEVSEGFQLKLLRVLQEGELERVGGSKTIQVKVRVLAATNKDLKEQVRLKRFREDLYYRLNVLTIVLPPLRERREDIPLLMQRFLDREGGELKVSKSVMVALQNHPWPGNMRELESVIRRGALLAKAEKRRLVTAHDLSEEIASAVQGVVRIEDQILDIMREKGFSRSSVSETAATLGGLSRGTVAEYLRGECLKAFTEQQFDLDRSVRYLTLSQSPDVLERLRRRMVEYLSNIAEGVDKNAPWDIAKIGLRPKTKNLTQRYHTYLEQTAEAFYRGLWDLPKKEHDHYRQRDRSSPEARETVS